ncbi:MAG TPA: hypothetical protein VHK01_20640 [Lacipirellulaceae bacterium]|nr:hypothetical protein [Lacipirellulaceae bacterium]
MADKPPAAAPCFDDAAGFEVGRSTPSEAAPESPLFRFRLRHLLAFVAAVSLLLAGLVTLQGIPALAFLLAALVVTFHVFSTALGSRLRSHSDREQARSFGRPRLPLARPSIPAPWYGREGDSVPWIPRLIATAVFFGGCLGAGFLTLTVGHRTSAAGLALGSISFAAISGWFAFLMGNFYVTFRRGLREALDNERKDQAITK